MVACLIVEDNPVHWVLTKNLVKKMGYQEVIVCENGVEALEYCRNHPIPELILLDGYMPEMDGLEFLAKFKEVPKYEVAYIVFCSSVTDQDYLDKVMQLGVDRYVPKPLNTEVLVKAISHIKAV